VGFKRVHGTTSLIDSLSEQGMFKKVKTLASVSATAKGDKLPNIAHILKVEI
jgi:hypothetical protein